MEVDIFRHVEYIDGKMVIHLVKEKSERERERDGIQEQASCCGYVT
jgi:hypothetical protein